jgi:hypothetical protein
MWPRWWIVALLLVVPPRVDGASLDVEAPVGLTGENVEVAVRLATDGEDVSGALTELSFDPELPISPSGSGDPDCVPEDAAGVLWGFTYQPSECTFGVDCERVRGALLSAEGLPDGVLFRCRVEIPAETPPDTAFPLDLVEGIVTDADGGETDVTKQSRDGGVYVVDEPLCAGDCNGDGWVAVSELVAGIDRALLRERLPCPFSDRQGDGTVDLSELIAAVENSLAVCPTRERRDPEREVVLLPTAPSAAGDLLR